MAITLSGNNLSENGNFKPLGKSQAEDFHTMVAKDLFLSNIVRNNIHPTTSVLATKLRSQNIIDQNISESIDITKWNEEASFDIEY